MKKIQKFILLGLTPIILYLFCGAIFNGYHNWMLSAFLPSLFVTSFLMFKRNDRSEHLKLGLIFVLPILILFFVPSFLGAVLATTISYILFIPMSVIGGWVYCKQRFMAVPIFSLLLFLVAGQIIYPNISTAYYNSTHQAKEFTSFPLMDENQNAIELDASKVLVLDFWTSSCGHCFKKFPDFEKYYLEFKDNPNIAFYAINSPLKRDKFDKVVDLVEELGYEFPTLYAKSMNDIKKMGIIGYPHLLIIKEGKVHYSGEFITDPLVYWNAKAEINRALNE